MVILYWAPKILQKHLTNIGVKLADKIQPSMVNYDTFLPGVSKKFFSVLTAGSVTNNDIMLHFCDAFG